MCIALKVRKVEMIFSSRYFLQKPNKRILLYYYKTSGRLLSIHFLEEIEDTKKTFQNYLTFNRNSSQHDLYTMTLVGKVFLRVHLSPFVCWLEGRHTHTQRRKKGPSSFQVYWVVKPQTYYNYQHLFILKVLTILKHRQNKKGQTVFRMLTNTQCFFL